MWVTDIVVKGSLVLGTLLKISDTPSSLQEPQMGDSVQGPQKSTKLFYTCSPRPHGDSKCRLPSTC